MKPARISLLDKKEAIRLGAEMGISEYIAGMNIFRALLNHPKLAGELNSTIIALVSGDKNGTKLISDRLREIIIMRVSWLAVCDYEWSQHWLASLFFGLNEAELLAIRDWKQACFNAQEQAVLLATDELLREKKISESTWEALKKHFVTDQALIEIITCIGNWHMFALILNGLDIPLDEGMTSWAPDGHRPSV